MPSCNDSYKLLSFEPRDGNVFQKIKIYFLRLGFLIHLKIVTYLLMRTYAHSNIHMYIQRYSYVLAIMHTTNTDTNIHTCINPWVHRYELAHMQTSIHTYM